MGCRKVRYRDRVGALIALSIITSADQPRHHESRAYRCPRCEGWHLTSEPQKTARKTHRRPREATNPPSAPGSPPGP